MGPGLDLPRRWGRKVNAKERNLRKRHGRPFRISFCLGIGKGRVLVKSGVGQGPSKDEATLFCWNSEKNTKKERCSKKGRTKDTKKTADCL